MEQLFNIDFKRINSSNDKEAADRKKNFELFLKGGLPNKKNENWKFSDLNYIISKNFKNITNNDEYTFDEKIETIHDFDHNKVILVNGSLKSSDLHFEEKGKVKIEIAVAKGKKLYDKRQVKKKRDWNREKARLLSKNNK